MIDFMLFLWSASDLCGAQCAASVFLMFLCCQRNTRSRSGDLLVAACRTFVSECVHRKKANASSKHDELRDKCVYVFTHCESSSSLFGPGAKLNDCKHFPLRHTAVSAPQGLILQRKPNEKTHTDKHTNTHSYSVPMKSHYNVSLLGSVSGEGASVRLHVLPKHSSPCREGYHPVSVCVNYFCHRFIFCFNRVLFPLTENMIS